MVAAVFLIGLCALNDDQIIWFEVDFGKDGVVCAVFPEHVEQKIDVAQFQPGLIGDDEGFLAHL